MSLLERCPYREVRLYLQRRFLAQRSVAMLEQCCNQSKQCRNNLATLQCCVKNRRCDFSFVTSPLACMLGFPTWSILQGFSLLSFLLIMHTRACAWDDVCKKSLRPMHIRGFAPGACSRLILHVSVHTRERFQVRSICPGSLLPNI